MKNITKNVVKTKNLNNMQFDLNDDGSFSITKFLGNGQAIHTMDLTKTQAGSFQRFVFSAFQYAKVKTIPCLTCHITFLRESDYLKHLKEHFSKDK